MMHAAPGIMSHASLARQAGYTGNASNATVTCPTTGAATVTTPCVGTLGNQIAKSVLLYPSQIIIGWLLLGVPLATLACCGLPQLFRGCPMGQWVYGMAVSKHIHYLFDTFLLRSHEGGGNGKLCENHCHHKFPKRIAVCQR